MADLLSTNETFYKQFEPQVKFRFILTIDGISAFTVKSATKPQISFDEIELNHMNVKRYVKGKASWQPLSLTLYHPIVPSAAQEVMTWVKESHEPTTGRDGYSDVYKKDITLNMLGPNGDQVEEWVIKGAWIQEANFGDLDWSSNEAVEIALTLRYDYAILSF